MKNISIISFTEDGAKLSERVASYLYTLKENCIVQQYEKTSYPFLKNAEQVEGSLADWCRQIFPKSDVILFIGAMGISVRGIASCVQDKFTDPAVLVMDEMGQHIIPVLSGHVGGANEFALELSEGLGADPVFTTATDLHQLFAVDVFAKKNNLVIADRQQAKKISVAILRKEKVYLYLDYAEKKLEDVDNSRKTTIQMCKREETNLPDELLFISKNEIEAMRRSEGNIQKSSVTKMIVVTDHKDFFLQNNKVENECICQLIPKCNVLGIGCRKGTNPDLLEETILHTLTEHRILLQSIARIATINIKKDEPAICAFSEKYQIPVDIFTAEELMSVQGEFSASEFVFSQTGTDNVCERAAVASALQLYETGRQDTKEKQNTETGLTDDVVNLSIKKQAGNGITLALATKDWSVTFE